LARLLGVSSTRFGNGTVSTAVITGLLFFVATLCDCFAAAFSSTAAGYCFTAFRDAAREIPCIE
jgi:hypothetical protein